MDAAILEGALASCSLKKVGVQVTSHALSACNYGSHALCFDISASYKLEDARIP